MTLLNLSKKNLIVILFIIIGAVWTGGLIATESRILWAPFLILFSWGWVRFATKYQAEALIIVVIFSESLFFIVDIGIKERFLSDIAVALMFIPIGTNTIKVIKNIITERTPYMVGILLFFVSILISQYSGAHLKFGQPIQASLIVVRQHLLFCSFFFLIAVGATKKDCFRFFKYLAWMGALISLLSVIEVILGGGIIFSQYYSIGEERAGLLRIHIGTFLIVFSIIYSFITFENSTKSKLQRSTYLFFLCLGLFTILFIVLTRAIFVGLLIGLLLWLPFKFNKNRLIFLCIVVSFFIIVIISGISERIIKKTFLNEMITQTSHELGSHKGNISIREKGAKFYLSLMLKNSPLTGVGIFSSTSYPNNPITKAAETFHYYIVDTMGISTIVNFGFQGLLLLVFFISKSLKDTIQSIKNAAPNNKSNYEVLFFVFIYILSTPTLNSIITENMLVYSGVFFYLLSVSYDKKIRIL